MEILIIAGIVLGGIWLLAKAAKTVDAHKKAESEERLKTEVDLGVRIAQAGTPAKMLAICEHRVPREVRLQRNEQPAWVVPDCEYHRTVKEVSYTGGSSGASFRVAKGVSVRASGSRGRRQEHEAMKRVDRGTAVLTDRHLYFAGEDKERFRVRLDKLVTAEATTDGLLFQRDGVRARPEAFTSPDARVLAIVLAVLADDHEPANETADAVATDADDGIEVVAAHQADTE